MPAGGPARLSGSGTVPSQERTAARPLEAGDSAAVLSLLSPDAVIFESGGVESRDEYRSHHLAGDIGFARAVRRTQGPVRATVRGDAARASSPGAAQGTDGQRAVNSTSAELMGLTREPAGWKIRAIHWSSRADARNKDPSGSRPPAGA